MSKPSSRLHPLLGSALRWGLGLVALLAALDLVYIVAISPDWAALAKGPIPKSRFMLDYEARRATERGLPPLRWQPVSYAHFPKHLVRAVTIAEDARFFTHAGFDVEAIQEAFDYNIAKGKLARGASTISQQAAKNLFLTPSRNWLRKWHEVVLTWTMERRLSKQRILELYLNTVELGRGVYGVEAAAQAYFGKPVSAITPREAAELAATLPSPVKANPATRTQFFLRHAATVESRLNHALGINGNADDAESAAPVDAIELKRRDAPAPR